MVTVKNSNLVLSAVIMVTVKSSNLGCDMYSGRHLLHVHMACMSHGSIVQIVIGYRLDD
jgi:hypothetical protein